MCVIGKDPVRRTHLQTRPIEGKRVNGTPDGGCVRSPDLAPRFSCQVSVCERGRSRAGFAEIAKRGSRLECFSTVGEGERFQPKRGGMIAFVMEGQRVRFQINLKGWPTEAGLKVSSKPSAAGGAGEQGEELMQLYRNLPHHSGS